MLNTMNKIDENPIENNISERISNLEQINNEEMSVQSTADPTEDEDKKNVGSIEERRVSQNSELNNDLRDSTPMQTDNEEV